MEAKKNKKKAEKININKMLNVSISYNNAQCIKKCQNTNLFRHEALNIYL